MAITAPKANTNLDLRELLQVVAGASSAAASETGANAPSAELAASLKKISQLATELAAELAQSQNLDPALHQRIQRVAPPIQRKLKAL
jgi:hypothetical protein